jgi:hypothetical protein
MLTEALNEMISKGVHIAPIEDNLHHLAGSDLYFKLIPINVLDPIAINMSDTQFAHYLTSVIASNVSAIMLLGGLNLC